MSVCMREKREIERRREKGGGGEGRQSFRQTSKQVGVKYLCERQSVNKTQGKGGGETEYCSTQGSPSRQRVVGRGGGGALGS